MACPVTEVCRWVSVSQGKVARIVLVDLFRKEGSPSKSHFRCLRVTDEWVLLRESTNVMFVCLVVQI